MKVTAKASVHFPDLDWGITAGETREAPEGKEAQELVLAHPDIEAVDGRVAPARKADKPSDDE